MNLKSVTTRENETETKKEMGKRLGGRVLVVVGGGVGGGRRKRQREKHRDREKEREERSSLSPFSFLQSNYAANKIIYEALGDINLTYNCAFLSAKY